MMVCLILLALKVILFFNFRDAVRSFFSTRMFNSCQDSVMCRKYYRMHTFQTDSRIEIIPKKNNIQKYLNRKLSSSINTRQIDNFHESFSHGGTLTSSMSQPEHRSSTTSQHKQFSSSTSEVEEIPSSYSRNTVSKVSSSMYCT